MFLNLDWSNSGEERGRIQIRIFVEAGLPMICEEKGLDGLKSVNRSTCNFTKEKWTISFCIGMLFSLLVF